MPSNFIRSSAYSLRGEYLGISDNQLAECAWFMNTHHFGKGVVSLLGCRVNDLRRFDIQVSACNKGDAASLRTAIRKVCKVLADIPRLDYIRIELDGVPRVCGQPSCTVL